MKRHNYILLVLSIIICLISCKSADKPNNILVNGDFSNSITNDWWSFRGSDNKFVTDISDSVYFSEKYSASIKCDSISQSFSYWGQTIGGDLPFNHRLNLKVRIKLDKVKGNGVGFAIRFDNTEKVEGRAEKFTTTQGIKQIFGTQDWREYELTSDLITKDIKSVTVYLLMYDNTIGTVYFDDVVLTEISD